MFQHYLLIKNQHLKQVKTINANNIIKIYTLNQFNINLDEFKDYKAISLNFNFLLKNKTLVYRDDEKDITIYKTIENLNITTQKDENYVLELNLKEDESRSNLELDKKSSPYQQLLTLSFNYFQSKTNLSESELLQLLQKTLPKKWELYNQFLLLPLNCFHQHDLVPLNPSFSWTEFFTSYMHHVFLPLFQVTHIAKKVSITPDDVLRRPTIQAYYGNFDHYFNLVTQNSITYCWAPKYTMFSQGNIKEKIRVTKEKIFQLENQIVLDLYAGIGYFTLPYLLKCGAKRVYACEWNPYSVVGLIKGAEINGVSYELVKEIKNENNQHMFQVIDKYVKKIEDDNKDDNRISNSIENIEKDIKLIILPGNNEDFINYYQNKVDRVNLGLIPTSFQGYELAILALNKQCGGYLHIHENVVQNEENNKIQQIQQELKQIFNKYNYFNWTILLINAVIIKNYGPLVYHMVFDFQCLPGKEE
ncbi:hypothetical protein K502DRAFT_71610 [Neoconidiobolus thromboides FSU 785]|nr:hypothetical protein K502DRAFT_71610 [Neoconidiobolus thromboides FSU 785]